jgi:shikimate kinase
MVPDRLFLVGFLGSPKYDVAHVLAERLRRPLFDVEEVIEAGARMSTQEIYRKEGESGFRQRERRALVSVATGPPSVIVTGAGTFIDRGNRRTMQLAGISVFVDGTLEECLERALEDGLLRPDDDSNERFAALFEVRRPEYERADVIVEPMNRDAEAVADEIMQRLEDRVWSENM